MKKFDESELESAGGKRWVSPRGNVRYYWSDLPGLLNWSVLRYSTGNISAASINGAKVSNTIATREVGRLDRAKFWYEILTGKFCSKDLDPTEHDRVAKQIKTRLEALTPPVPSEEKING